MAERGLKSRRRETRGYHVVLAALALLPLDVAGARGEGLDYNQDVRPVLSDACFHCHGTDPSTREADLRLDRWESHADYEFYGAEMAIDRDDPEYSALLDRIRSDDPEHQMPPPESGKTLSDEGRAVLERWVAEGAEYQPHWAFAAPERPPLPDVAKDPWVRNPIDAFVLARLRAEGLEPSPRADAETLRRRLCLDLVGLPPAFDAAVAAAPIQSDAQYDRAVERLLASPHFGERWGRDWLDAARYADSNGYEKDRPRDVWLYRDWVIRAMNDDMPYSQFVVKQVAGDLLPKKSQDNLVATTFLRNSMVNEEGGIDPEQFRMEGLFDRMDAIGKSVLGLTLQCAQCHTHKYDPLTHTDYFRTLAFLNGGVEANAVAYTDEDRTTVDRIESETRRIEQELASSTADWRERLADWERDQAGGEGRWTVVRPEVDGTGGQKHYLQEDGSVLARGYAPSQITTEFAAVIDSPRVTAFRLELMTDPTLPYGGPGRSLKGLCALSEFKVVLKGADGQQDRELAFDRATADVSPPVEPLADIFDDGKDIERVTGPATMAIDGDEATAWGIDVGPGRSNVSRKAVFVLKEPLDEAEGRRVVFKLVQMHGQDYMKDIYSNGLGRFRFSITDDPTPSADPLPFAVRRALTKRPDERSDEEDRLVFSHWRTAVAEWKEANERIERLEEGRPQGMSQLVMQRRDKPRVTHRLDRGEFTKPAEVVEPGVPAFLHSLEVENPTRLDFARWLVDRRSPTTARTIVNRVWQSYFGQGIVATPGDFGAQGAPPSHPKLLDWLAVELMDSGWRLKHLHRLIVGSATYQQSSVVSPELLEADPSNALLTRGARFRVDAEVVRDVALTASGLLNPALGGPGVYPPAPAFLFKQPVSFAPKPWDFDQDNDKYRRAVYTFRYRTTLYPVYQAFDAPSGDVSCVRRNRSNTPLQALALLNEELFVECAQNLAAETLSQPRLDDAERIAWVYERCLAREPEARESAVLTGFLDNQRERFAAGDADPNELVGDVPSDAEPVELAAWTALSRVVLSLDETITKE
ncbi:Planctomycete cytochrome C [Pseudobythopirellula maris]|uniref:Planctomycete cytochrome C n=1 Tax=Pseudobythopirellula maris TaxID=2527991 RepID=A0A5C5ZVB9_9BACT|nr:PSD1 and planctomycete cytochrome C domain-containing protein [Pseudobythopirellula maris]TWT91065.1 Planctomycete cytochrome C [Pseudobythopirellula maris]